MTPFLLLADTPYRECGFTIYAFPINFSTNGRDDLRTESILALGSVINDEMRETVKEGLGSKTVDRYSSQDKGYTTIRLLRYELGDPEVIDIRARLRSDSL